MDSKAKSTVTWLMDFTVPHKKSFIASVICAVIGVALSIVPYYFVAQRIIHLIHNDRSLSYYTICCLWAVGIWLLRYIFHGVSTTFSHKVTFAVNLSPRY